MHETFLISQYRATDAGDQTVGEVPLGRGTAVSSRWTETFHQPLDWFYSQRSVCPNRIPLIHNTADPHVQTPMGLFLLHIFFYSTENESQEVRWLTCREGCNPWGTWQVSWFTMVFTRYLVNPFSPCSSYVIVMAANDTEYELCGTYERLSWNRGY